LPARVPAPDRATPDLPADRPVGPAAMVYSPCPETCWRVLVSRDGTQFWLSTPGRVPGHERLAGLSPDGRWVAYPNADGDLVLRDLTTVTAVTFPGMQPRAWSPGGRFLALVPVNFETPAPVTVVDLTTAKAVRTVTVDRPKDGRLLDFAGILDTGELIWARTEVIDLGPDGKPLRLEVTDPDGRAVLRQIAVRPPAGTTFTPMWPNTVRPFDDGTMMVRFSAVRPWGITAGPADIIDAGGNVLARYPVPITDDHYDSWIASGVVDGRVLAVHARAEKPSVVTIDQTGRQRTVSVLDGGYGGPALPGTP